MSDAGPTFRLIYSSHSKIPKDSRDTVLANIFDTARSNNRKIGVTGALLITDHYFVQALEGDESTVNDLYQRISEDDRHDKVSILESGEVPARVFSKWSMAQVSKSGRADIPLHDSGGKIHPAAARSLTADQTAMLKKMRNVIGADSL